MAAATVARRLVSAAGGTGRFGSALWRPVPKAPWRPVRSSVALAAKHHSSRPAYRYAKSHEWVSMEGNTATIGISDHAQDKLGEVVFVELPEVGSVLEAQDQLGVLESVKAVAEVYSPVSGKVIDVNRELENSPNKINEDPLGEGWLAKLEVEGSAELDSLMLEDQYEEFLKEGI